jgi:Ca2+-binding RTX toxin-like protein
VTYEGRDEDLRLIINSRAESGRRGERDRIFTDVENVNGGEGDDCIVGSKYENILRGGPGNDTLKGEGGDDILEGEDGDDRLVGGRGADVFYGGHGSDLLDARDGSARDLVYGKDFSNRFDGFDRALIDRSWLGKDLVWDVDLM